MDINEQFEKVAERYNNYEKEQMNKMNEIFNNFFKEVISAENNIPINEVTEEMIETRVFKFYDKIFDIQ